MGVDPRYEHHADLVAARAYRCCEGIDVSPWLAAPFSLPIEKAQSSTRPRPETSVRKRKEIESEALERVG